MATPLVTCSCASHASASTASFPRCWSRICQGLDDPVQVFWNRPLAFLPRCHLSPQLGWGPKAGDLQIRDRGRWHHGHGPAGCAGLRWATARRKCSGLASCVAAHTSPATSRPNCPRAARTWWLQLCAWYSSSLRLLVLPLALRYGHHCCPPIHAAGAALAGSPAFGGWSARSGFVLAFGSRARGDDRPDSDLDLAVIVQEPSLLPQGKLQWWTQCQQPIGSMGIGVDLVIQGAADAERLSQSRWHLMGDVAREGLVLLAAD